MIGPVYENTSGSSGGSGGNFRFSLFLAKSIHNISFKFIKNSFHFHDFYAYSRTHLNNKKFYYNGLNFSLFYDKQDGKEKCLRKNGSPWKKF